MLRYERNKRTYSHYARIANQWSRFSSDRNGAAVAKLESTSSLKDKIIKVNEPVNTAIARAQPLEDAVTIIENLHLSLVISGPTSKAQEQLLQNLSAKKIVYLDNFNYNPLNPSFETVKDVINVAQKIICVSDHVKEQIEAQSAKLNKKILNLLGAYS
jgi:hypothetical protein